jgi:hypothetical protein
MGESVTSRRTRVLCREPLIPEALILDTNFLDTIPEVALQRLRPKRLCIPVWEIADLAHTAPNKTAGAPSEDETPAATNGTVVS